VEKVPIGIGDRCHPFAPLSVSRFLDHLLVGLAQSFDLAIYVLGVQPQVDAPDFASVLGLRQAQRQRAEPNDDERGSPSSGNR